MNIKQANNSELIKIILLLHGFVIILLLAYFGKFLFIPLFFSFLIAVFLYPLSSWFEKRFKPPCSFYFVCCYFCVDLLNYNIFYGFAGCRYFQRIACDYCKLCKGFANKNFTIDFSYQYCMLILGVKYAILIPFLAGILNIHSLYRYLYCHAVKYAYCNYIWKQRKKP